MRKQGISLIMLVITIIVMTIIAGVIIFSLSDSGIFDKANDAVKEYNNKQQQIIDDLKWAENYLNGLNGGASNVPTEWQNSVVAIVDGVPIPKGFVASPYAGENTKDGGFVIYALKEDETSIPTTEARQTSLETRNQFVWVPVDKENFATEFVRDAFGKMKYEYDEETDTDYEVAIELSNKLGEGFWELVLDKDNMPSQDTENDNVEDYVSAATLQEVTAMYESVAEYGGFYIARYEVGYTYDEEGNKVPSITMGKYPYNSIDWSNTQGGAVALSRAFYPNNSTNTTGVVSTLTYGVQWDTTLNWWTGKDLTDSTEYGNYYNTAISSDEYNANAKYSDDNGSSWKDAVAKGSNGWLLTTGAFKNANVNNIYDMAGNLFEWTMEGDSSDHRVGRGGNFGFYGNDYPVVTRNIYYPYNVVSDVGFRPSLYIK